MDENEDGAEDLDDDEDGFELIPTVESISTQKTKSTKSARKSGEPIQVLSYRHREIRVNNPEVGMVMLGRTLTATRRRGLMTRIWTPC